MRKRAYLAILMSLVFLISLIFPQIYMAQASTQILRNYDFYDFNSEAYWECFKANGDDPFHYDYPEYDRSTIERSYPPSYWYGHIEDSENWDWSDVVVAQGKKPHESGNYGLYGMPLSYEPILNYEPDSSPSDGTLIIQIRAKIDPNSIKWLCYHNPLRGHQPSVSLVVMVYFEIYVHDKWGNEYWRDFSNPNRFDGSPDMAVCEKFNRWIYNYENGGFWHEASGDDPKYNYFTDMTTHDTDFHSIMAGWQFGSDAGKWKTFTWDVSRDFRRLCDWIYIQYVMDKVNFYIVKGRVKTVMVAVEGYCGAMTAYVDWVKLIYNG